LAFKISSVSDSGKVTLKFSEPVFEQSLALIQKTAKVSVYSQETGEVY